MDFAFPETPSFRFNAVHRRRFFNQNFNRGHTAFNLRDKVMYAKNRKLLHKNGQDFLDVLI